MRTRPTPRPSPLYVLFAALLAACTPPRLPRPPPAWFIERTVDPPADHTRVARLPTVAVAFDRALAIPGPDAVWLVTGAPSPALATDAARGALSTTNSARRIDALVRLDPADPARVLVTPLAPLAPESTFTVVTSARLTSADGAPALAPRSSGAPGGVVAAFSVAPVNACPSLARLAFPLREGAPRSAARVVVAFDRPVNPTVDPEGIAWLVGPTGRVATVAALDCGDDVRGYVCAVLAVHEALEPAGDYRVELGALTDVAGFAPQAADLSFRTTEGFDPVPAAASGPLVCADDEHARPPFCVRVGADWIEVRGATVAPGALRVSTADIIAETPAGTAHTARITGLPPGESYTIAASTLSLDGAVAEQFELEAIQGAPPLPHLRITEVLARPHSASAQEFVEIVNDSEAPADLTGLLIATPSGRAAFPPITLEPFARAVVVGSAFDPRGEPRAGDPAVAPGAILVRLESASIASRGLADRGTDVWLADAEGHIMSRCPSGDSSRPPRQGVSLIRVDGHMREEDPASWSYDAAGGSTPGLPDAVP